MVRRGRSGSGGLDWFIFQNRRELYIANLFAVSEVVERSERIVTRDILRPELERFATKEFLRAEFAELRAELGHLRSELGEQEARLRTEITNMRAGLRSEFRADMTALEERINRKLYALLGVLALLITIYEFIG